MVHILVKPLVFIDIPAIPRHRGVEIRTAHTMLPDHILHKGLTTPGIAGTLCLHISLGKLEIGHHRGHLLIRQYPLGPLYAGRQANQRGKSHNRNDSHFLLPDLGDDDAADDASTLLLPIMARARFTSCE